jgi:hypothetical protein
MTLEIWTFGFIIVGVWGERGTFEKDNQKDNRKGYFFFVVRSGALRSEAHRMRSVSGAFIGGGGFNSLGHSERTFEKDIYFLGWVGGVLKKEPFGV